MNCFCGRVDRRKAFIALYTEIFTIPNLQHAASRIWTWAEPEFRFSWMKLFSSDNHYTTAPIWIYQHKPKRSKSSSLKSLDLPKQSALSNDSTTLLCPSLNVFISYCELDIRKRNSKCSSSDFFLAYLDFCFHEVP